MSSLVGQLHDLVLAMSEDQAEGIKIPRVTQFAAAAVPGAEHAGISLIENGKPPRTIAATGDVPVQVDAIQYELAEGPCVQALIQSDLVWSGDLTKDQQWPRFAPRAVEVAGVRSMASYRLFLTQHRRGALNFYASRPQAFDQLALGIGALFAAYASLTLLNDLHEDKIMNLERALESSREIGCAMGILMARELCTQDQAFAMLRTASQHAHRKLRDIAAEVKETGMLPYHPRLTATPYPPASAIEAERESAAAPSRSRAASVNQIRPGPPTPATAPPRTPTAVAHRDRRRDTAHRLSSE